MSKPIRMSMQTRMNWLIDLVVFVGGILAGLSGVYFLYLPSGGYEGGRNPMYGVTILWDRHSWSDLHAWGGILMIAAIAIHFAIHWQWVKRIARRTVSALSSGGDKLSKGARFNVAIDLLVAVSFLICAVTGIYFLFAPSGGFQGGRNLGWDPGFLFSRTTWDLIHTWSGVVLGVAAVVHFAIHWRWVKNVTARFFLSLRPQPDLKPAVGKATLVSNK
jgi:cytochrome b subunit of formate dehydrogenase